MDQSALKALLETLIHTWENEVVEFKQAGNDYSSDRIGEYFSALSNEANLRGLDCAWLVFGVHNKTRAIVGTSYRVEPERLQGLKYQLAQSTEPSVTSCSATLSQPVPGPSDGRAEHDRHHGLRHP